MPSNPHILCCNGARVPQRASRQPDAQFHDLATFGPAKNVRLVITDLTDRMAEALPDRICDLVELAAIIYAADQSCKRLFGKTIDYGEKWNRSFSFHVAVRDSSFWSQKKVIDSLVATLGFLSDDNYEFTFTRMTAPPQFQEYLDFSSRTRTADAVDRVVLFSGGLDSLAGAVEEIICAKRKLALVSHKPVAQIGVRQRELVSELVKRSGDPSLRPVHFPVLANRIDSPDGDYTQRTRSFLYAALAAAVAQYFKLQSIYFYENGVVSVNLPLCAQEIGGRATRTTHPQTLANIERLFSLVTEQPFVVRNEFLWETKEDVLRRLQNAGQSDLARSSVSCSHTRQYRTDAPHCGLCSQCLSRYIAGRGADYGDDDPNSGYRHSVLTDPRKLDEDRILAERFVGKARQVESMTTHREFHDVFSGELSRVYPYLGISASVGAEKLFDLHHRHAKQVGRVMHLAMKENLEERRVGRLADTCVANYAFDGGGKSKSDVSQHADEHSQLIKAVRRLNEMQRKLITALFDRNILGPNAKNRPSQEILATWIGVEPDATLKNALSSLVKAEYLDNARHHGARGGYYLTLKGESAGELLQDD